MLCFQCLACVSQALTLGEQALALAGPAPEEPSTAPGAPEEPPTAPGAPPAPEEPPTVPGAPASSGFPGSAEQEEAEARAATGDVRVRDFAAIEESWGGGRWGAGESWGSEGWGGGWWGGGWGGSWSGW